MCKNEYKKILVFTLNFIAYSIMLFYKYVKCDSSIRLSTVIEGYFLVNIFFSILIFPVYSIHKILRNSEFFLNNKIFSKILQILLLIGSYIAIIKLPYIIMPLDVMSSFLLWLYLYFCLVFTVE